MDGTENLIAFEEPEVRERRLKAQQIKGMLERLPPPTTFAQPFGGGNLAIPARPQSMSSPPSMIFSPVQTIPRSDGSSEGNSFESCQSTTDWEKFEDDSTISSAPTVTDNVSLSGISFIAEETVQPTEPLLITNPFCSQTAPGKRHLSSDLIELDDDWDVLRRFDPIVSSLSMPKVGNVTVVRTRDKVKHADTATLPLTIVNKGRFDDSAMQRSNSTSSVSSKRSLSIKPFSFADLKLTRKESTVVTQLKRLESKLSAKLEANGSGDNITHWSQGVIISPRSKISNPPWLVSSVKLIVHTPKEYSPLKFTCSVSTEVESLIYQVLYSINSEEPASSYALKIWGKDEYLVNESGLAEYVHVYTSIKLNKDIELSLVSTDLLLCQHMQQEGDRNSDEEKKPLEAVCSRVIPTLIQEIPMRELLKQLTNESSRLIAAAANGEPVETTKFCQLLKALCAVFRAVVPFDLNDSIDRLKSAAHSLSDERRTLMRSPNAITSPPRSSPEYISQFNKAMQSVCGSVHRLIATFCQNPTSEFVIEPVEERQTDTRELISLEYQLLFCAESLHNLPANWITDYEKFILKCFVFYGTASLLKGEEIICGPATVDHSGFYPAVYFKQLIQIDSCELCILPREARLSFVLHGMRLVPVNETNNTLKPGTENGAAANDHFTMAELGWSSVCLFDNDGHLRQGPVVLSFAKTGLFQPWGTDSTCFCPDSKSVQLLISFTRYQFDVRFPEVEAVDRTSRGSNNPTMDEATRTYLNDIIFNQDPNYGLQPDEKDTLWEKRYGLIDIPDALPLVLSSAIAWDWASLNNTYHLLNTFTPLCPVKAMDLLLPKFPDKEVRRKAVEWISVASADDLINYLPQLVEVLRFELREDSDIAAYLLSVASCDWKFAHRLYWQLEERCSLAEHIGLRCRLLKEVLMRILGARGTEIFQREKWLLSQLDTVAAAVKNSNNSSHRQILMKHLDPLDHQLNSEGVCLPIEPAFKASGFELPVCSYFESKTRPLDLVFKNAESSYGAIYKVGDDLRQDALVIQLVSLMERIWLNAGLDLKVLTFQCLPTGKCKGLVEKVPHSRTLRQIQVEGGGLTGSFRDSLLVSWIQKHNPSELDYEIALANFRKSSSAWCVCSYVLGLGDRHNDNILITTKGHVFHIDFGKYLGDFEKFGKFKRDRVPFVLTSDMAYVINAGSKQKTTFQEFVDDCCKAFNCLRNNSFQIMSALKLMVCSGIPGVSIDAVRFVHQKLLLDRTDTEATARFSRMIMETLKSIAPKMNFFIHNLAQWNSAASDENPSQLLSFTPATFSLATEGKIVLVEVLSCEKRQLPEKHYLFKMNVYREQETVATVVYRTYKEFYEFFEKIYMRFPLAEVCALSGGPTIGRSNIRVVAEGQKLEIIDFLDSLFSLSAEVAHCDLVYTFFHPLLRDQQEAERSDSGVGGENTGTMAPVPSLTGSIKLSVSYSRTRKELEVFVQHVKNLIPVGGRLPDTYVKIYLRPDPIRASKRKTKVEKSNCNPVFMERFVYLYPPAMLKTRQLELTVWQHDYLKENSFLGGVQMPLTEISESRTADTNFEYMLLNGKSSVDNEIVMDGWFALGRITRVPTVSSTGFDSHSYSRQSV